MTDEKFYDEAYSILVEIGGAPENMREAFLHSFVHDPYFDFGGCSEWRFQGKLGYGGKFWRRTHPTHHDVTCYREDETPEIVGIIQEINQRLEALDQRRDTP